MRLSGEVLAQAFASKLGILGGVNRDIDAFLKANYLSNPKDIHIKRQDIKRKILEFYDKNIVSYDRTDDDQKFFFIS